MQLQWYGHFGKTDIRTAPSAVSRFTAFHSPAKESLQRGQREQLCHAAVTVVDIGEHEIADNAIKVRVTVNDSFNE